MLKTWEKMANSFTKDVKEIPEDINSLLSEIRLNCPEMLLKLGLVGDSNVKAESLVALHRFGSWGSFGMPIFQVTEDLVASLILTDPQNVLADEIQFPYRAFLIKIPDDFWELESLMDGAVRKICWIWVHEYKQVDKHYNDTTWWRIDSVSDDGTCITYFDRRPEVSLKDFLSTGQIINSPLYTGMSQPEEGISYAMRRLVINLCLYLSEVGDMEKKKTFSKSAKAGKKKKPKPVTWVVGRSVKIGKELIEASKDWTRSKQGNRSEWTIKKRFAVRGHWRNQPCGEERRLRKRIWIAPHWKGPGKGEKLPRVYSVES
ncbi:MAG: hypothetical protein GWN86_09655 [Desulfobacterales bacterium]|nr:hypothetical protein [Desulfobacterales bacterium]